MNDINKTEQYRSDIVKVIFPIITLIVMIVCGLSCIKQYKPSDYVFYWEKHKKEFSTTIERSGYTVTVTYCPAELLAARLVNQDKSFSVDSMLAKFKNGLLFNINIQSNDPSKSMGFETDGKGREGYSSTIEKNTFQKDQEIFLSNGTDTVPVAAYQYERNWGLGSGDAFTVSFAKGLLKGKPTDYRLYLRNMSTEIGTIDVSLKDMVPSSKISLKG
jgi:hypothetical protein